MTKLSGASGWLLAVIVLLGLSARAQAQLGTTQSNVSSNSTQVHITSYWRSSYINNITYEAYSNRTDASVTFNWVGVGASYVAIKGADRGLCQLELDATAVYTLDLYNDSGYDQGEEIIWTSPVLPYGEHNATITQIGEDSRLGYYPYLFTETWIQVYPTDVVAYVSTELTSTQTGTGSKSTARPDPDASPDPSSHHSNIAPIVGGVVGGVVACALLGFLVYLWKRDKAARARGEVGGIKIQKVKRADGKIAIDDEPKAPLPSPPANAYDPYAHNYNHQPQPPPPPGAYYAHHAHHAPPAPVHSHSLDGSAHLPLLAPGARFPPASSNPPSSPSHASYGYASYPQSHSHSAQSHSSPHAYDYPATATAGEVMPSNGGSARSDTRAYPYHTQGFGEDSRRYPVPEI